MSSETQWLLWPHSTRGDELIAYCHKILVSTYQANEINIMREMLFNAGTSPRCERAQLSCYYNMTKCECYRDFAHKKPWVLAQWMRGVQMTKPPLKLPWAISHSPPDFIFHKYTQYSQNKHTFRLPLRINKLKPIDNILIEIIRPV